MLGVHYMTAYRYAHQAAAGPVGGRYLAGPPA